MLKQMFKAAQPRSLFYLQTSRSSCPHRLSKINNNNLSCLTHRRNKQPSNPSNRCLSKTLQALRPSFLMYQQVLKYTRRPACQLRNMVHKLRHNLLHSSNSSRSRLSNNSSSSPICRLAGAAYRWILARCMQLLCRWCSQVVVSTQTKCIIRATWCHSIASITISSSRSTNSTEVAELIIISITTGSSRRRPCTSRSSSSSKPSHACPCPSRRRSKLPLAKTTSAALMIRQQAKTRSPR